MKLEHYPVEKLKKQIIEIIKKYLDISKYKIFFFGSRVKGDSFPRADVDIGIEGPSELSASIKLDIAEDLDNLSTLYKFDFVDFSQVSSSFRKEALKNIELIKP